MQLNELEASYARKFLAFVQGVKGPPAYHNGKRGDPGYKVLNRDSRNWLFFSLIFVFNFAVFYLWRTFTSDATAINNLPDVLRMILRCKLLTS